MAYAAYCCMAAGALAAALLVFLDPVAEACSGRRQGVGARVARIILFFLVPALAVFPALVLAGSDSGAGVGLWLLLYVVFFSLFCYHFGKRIGLVRGEARLRELMGLDSKESTEDAQDRLFESRMRFPLRAEVVKSIGEMAGKREVGNQAAERRSGGYAASSVPIIDLSSPPPETDKRP